MKTEVAAKTRSRNRQATEDALIAAASAVFAERGYENATTKHVAEVAGFSEGLIQRYFQGKEGLLFATLRDDPQRYPAHLEFFDRPLCATLVDEAGETIANAAKIIGSRAQAIRIVISRRLVDPAFGADFHRITVRTAIRKALLARFGRYVDAGLIDPRVDLPTAVEMLLGINFQLGFMHPEMLGTSKAEVRRLIAAQAAMFARAIAPEPPSRAVAAAVSPSPGRPRAASRKASS